MHALTTLKIVNIPATSVMSRMKDEAHSEDKVNLSQMYIVSPEGHRTFYRSATFINRADNWAYFRSVKLNEIVGFEFVVKEKARFELGRRVGL